MDQGALQEAVRWAAKMHRGQDRDGPAPLPYITHPIDVMNILRYVGRVEDEEILCAAALHDVVEESGASLQEIQERFGERVAQLVRELTREEPGEDLTREMSEDEIADLRSRILLSEIGMQSPDAQKVKLADRLSNLRSALVTRTGKKLDRYVVQSEQILEIVPRDVCPPIWDAIKALLPQRRSSPEAARR